MAFVRLVVDIEGNAQVHVPVALRDVLVANRSLPATADGYVIVTGHLAGSFIELDGGPGTVTDGSNDQCRCIKIQ